MHSKLAFLLLLLVAQVQPGQTQAQSSPTSQEPSLLPGDVVKVDVWREEDLSGEFLVDESGWVHLPLLGRRAVTSIPLVELRDSLLVEYEAHLRYHPVITPLRRVYVLGEVNEPGLYTVDPTVSLAGAVALAGGGSGEGDLRKIRVFRAGELVLNNVPATSALTAADVRSGDQIFVERRGWFERNSTFVVSAVLSITSIAISVLR